MASLRGNSVSVLADGYAQLALDLAIPTCLEEVGIQEKDLELLSTEASKIAEQHEGGHSAGCF